MYLSSELLPILMKFGQLSDLKGVDFTLPEIPQDDLVFLTDKVTEGELNLRVGGSKWTKADLKNFYPKGVKDELAYYSSQYNAVELNASFYRIFPKEQFEQWKNRTSDDFKFYPKVPRIISHIRRLNLGSYPALSEFLDNVAVLQQKLGTCFLQLPENFAPMHFERLKDFISQWPRSHPLAIEFRHPQWFESPMRETLIEYLRKKGISLVLTDTAGRRDLIHMKLSTTHLFIRFVAVNRNPDDIRIEGWLERIEDYKKAGLKYLSFFIHQSSSASDALLASDFVSKFNLRFETSVRVPQGIQSQGNLFQD